MEPQKSGEGKGAVGKGVLEGISRTRVLGSGYRLTGCLTGGRPREGPVGEGRTESKVPLNLKGSYDFIFADSIFQNQACFRGCYWFYTCLLKYPEQNLCSSCEIVEPS